MPRKDVTLEIYLDGDTPRVRCTDPADCDSDGVPQVWQKKWVEWTAADEGRAWTVVFLADTGPFKNNQRVFSCDDPKGKLPQKSSTNGVAFDYCVSYQAADGSMKHSDPRVMVRDEVDYEPQYLMADAAEDTAAYLDELCQVIQELKEIQEKLAQGLRAAPDADASAR